MKLVFYGATGYVLRAMCYLLCAMCYVLCAMFYVLFGGLSRVAKRADDKVANTLSIDASNDL